MQTLILWLHALVRWAVILSALNGIVLFSLVSAGRVPGVRAAWGAMRAFTAILSIQFVLGLLVLALTWNSAQEVVQYRLLHAALGLIALGIGHASSAWRNQPDTVRARNNVIDIVVVLLVIFIGVSLLPGGWGRPLLPPL